MAPEDAHGLKVVVGLACLGLIALAVIELLELEHRVRKAGGVSAWWSAETPEKDD